MKKRGNNKKKEKNASATNSKPSPQLNKQQQQQHQPKQKRPGENEKSPALTGGRRNRKEGVKVATTPDSPAPEQAPTNESNDQSSSYASPKQGTPKQGRKNRNNNNNDNKAYAQVDEQTKEKWNKEVQELKSKLILKDAFDWKLVVPDVASTPATSNPSSWAGRLFAGQQSPPPPVQVEKTEPLKLIGGLDLSYVKGDNKRPHAVATLVVCSYPSLEVVYEAEKQVKITEPYLSGFLSFREVSFFLELLNELKSAQADLYPQLLIVDGNGLLHQKGFGLACHVGVLVDLPTIGVAKKLLPVDGIMEQHVKKLTTEHPLAVGEALELTGRSGNVHGAIMRTTESGRPIFVSVGHRISLKTAVDIVRELCPKDRLPYPTDRKSVV